MSNQPMEHNQAVLFSEKALSAQQAKPEKPVKITPHMGYFPTRERKVP